MRLSIARCQTDTSPVIPTDWRRILAKFPEDIRDAWEERAAIIQYDGCEPRPTAERRAFECVVGQFEVAARLLRDHVAIPTARAAGRSSVG
jgi:hypothetical protein